MRGFRGVGGHWGPPPLWNLQSLISPILLEMKKIVIFHICSLPQLYVKQNNNQISSIQVCVMGFFLLKVAPPPRKNYLDPHLSLH